MRYNNRTAFLNQIKKAASVGAICRTYWVAVSHDYERAQIIDELLHLMNQGKENIQKWTEFDSVSIGNHLQTSSLFNEEPVAFIENAESLTKGDGILLEKLFPKDFGFLICSAKSKGHVSEKVEASGVVLDLLMEKPWDREKRVQQALETLVHRSGKTMAQNALSALMQRQDLEEGILEREIEKLICYTGDRSSISVEDVEAVCNANRTYAVWQTAEKVVWEGDAVLEEAHFHALVPSLRSQLQLGLKIATLVAENAPQEEWIQALPKVFAKTLEKRTRDASRLGTQYFKKGLETLFEIELASRTGSQHLGALLDMFHCTLVASAFKLIL